MYNLFSSKYRNGLHWIICGDTNDLKLDDILSLNSNLKQVVQNPTRLNPPRILDPIITTLSSFYQVPVCLDPLDPDPDMNGKPSDHLMVVMTHISVLNNRPARIKKKLTFRPFNDERLKLMKEWVDKEDWSVVINEKSADKKMEILQKLLVSKYHEHFPEKSRIISSDDEPYYTAKLGKMKRKKCREYHKNRRSNKWKKLDDDYNDELENAKMIFFINKIKKLRRTNPRKWHRELKKLTRFDQHKGEEITVEEIKDLTDMGQAEKIAEKFAKISREYEKLEKDDIEIPQFSENDILVVTEKDVQEILEGMDINKLTVNGDIPAKLLKHFSKQLAFPVANVINSSIVQGIWPSILKLEIVTPVAKVFPPKSMDQLRNISGL